MSRVWTGRMQTSLLNDRQVHPKQYNKWKDAHRRFARRPKDLKTVEEYKDMLRQGKPLPLMEIGISDRDNAVYLTEGHHRAVALRDLGTPDFPFKWYWIRNSGVHWETGPFPYDLAKNL